MITEKRNSLEKFLREQLIGPGGCNYQFESVSNNIESNLPEGECYGEVVNTTPGSIYSSAVLFPLQDDKETANKGDGNDTKQNDPPNDDDGNDNPPTDSSNDDVTDFGEDIDSLGRRFPSCFGISCCLRGDNINSDLHIKISGRYYIKIKNKQSIRIKVSDVESFTAFISEPEYKRYFNDLVTIEGDFIKITQSIREDDLKQYRENLRKLNIFLCKRVATNPDDSVCPIYNAINDNARFFSSYKERLFDKLTYVSEDGTYEAAGQEDAIKQRIADIEKYETCISYIEDVFSVFNSRDFGFWQAVNFEKTILLQDIDLMSGRRSFKADDYPLLKGIVKHKISDDIYISLDTWLQVLRKEDQYYLKVLLVNSSTKVKDSEIKYFSIVTEKVNERCFFGMKVDISSPNLVEYHQERRYDAQDEEANRLKFLYRNIKDYGVGHLCSVDWRKDDKGILHVYSDFLPTYETPDVEPVPRNKTQEVTVKEGKKYAKEYLENTRFLQFKELSVFSSATDDEIKDGLIAFIEKYNDWIQSLPSEDEHARKNIAECKIDYRRIKSNIQDFLSDSQKMLAFRLMNAAMFMQLWHKPKYNQNLAHSAKTPLTFDFYREADDTSIYKDSNGRGIPAAWRPFQLAFILLNLDGIFQRNPNEEWRERNEKVDLVWFPTGGGKTEAYLGIIALAIINRRQIFGQKGYGTAAIMRYTLRLLTTQQFQRAFRLILALEQIRRWDNSTYNLGDEEISIGLYVGKGSLPNSEGELKEEVINWNKTHGKIPLDRCPWCGEEIDVDTDGPSFMCSNPNCTFGDYEAFYPVRLCDDHIYKNPPSLLFGTVDKFAQLAHKVDKSIEKDSRRIFSSNGCIPPDLIIQDELHLLLGPLGSAVALFENAIDQLCTRTDDKGHKIRPKIISSTATTRNTSFQIRALYDREVSIFPKSGIDYDDSFFAFYKMFKEEGDAEWKHLGKRKYIGVLPTGRTQMTTQIRLAAILFVHRAIFELKHIDSLTDDNYIEAADYYYTIISYFNSLKEVGKTDAQFYQEFSKYTRRLFKRVLRYSNMLECFYAYNTHFKKSELTGRLSGEEAIEALQTAEDVKWNPEKRLPFQENGKWKRAKLPADMVLATNMISVGLDVSRFNTIIMNSMPRNIAEYIQASSRVARDKQGLVVTLHSPFNQRDVSHFEKFREFHEKLYYYVEPISITPFSPKSVVRFLPLYLASMIRHNEAYLAIRTDASKIDQQTADNLKQNLKYYFKERMRRTNSPLLTQDMLNVVYNEIDRNIDNWLRECNDAKTNQKNLVYKEIPIHPRANEIPLFASPEDYEGDVPNDKWLVPNALRVIEPEAVIHVIK